MTKDRLFKLSEDLGNSKSRPLLLSILLRGLSGGYFFHSTYSDSTTDCK